MADLWHLDEDVVILGVVSDLVTIRHYQICEYLYLLRAILAIIECLCFGVGILVRTKVNGLHIDDM